MHPRVAINLGQWISPAFDVKVSRWVTDWMMGRDVPGAFMPEHVRRFLKNRAKIPHTHFSMLNEIYLNLFATLEDYGIIPPDKIMPDISTGRMFSDFLRSKGIDPYHSLHTNTNSPTIREGQPSLRVSTHWSISLISDDISMRCGSLRKPSHTSLINSPKPCRSCQKSHSSHRPS